MATSTDLSSTWCEFDPNTAYVVCISICPYFLIWYPYAPTSLYGNTAHCSGYGVAMGCYRLCIVPRTAIVTSQWYDRYCFMEYARTWAKHPTTPWQREWGTSAWPYRVTTQYSYFIYASSGLNGLTNYGLVILYSIITLGQHWFR